MKTRKGGEVRSDEGVQSVVEELPNPGSPLRISLVADKDVVFVGHAKDGRFTRLCECDKPNRFAVELDLL